MYVPNVLFRKEKFYPRFVIRCCLFNGAVILRWFPSNFRSASFDHNSAFFFVPRHCTAHRINRLVSSISVTFHANGRIILCILASLSRVCGWLHERTTVVHTSLIKRCITLVAILIVRHAWNFKVRYSRTFFFITTTTLSLTILCSMLLEWARISPRVFRANAPRYLLNFQLTYGFPFFVAHIYREQSGNCSFIAKSILTR